MIRFFTAVAFFFLTHSAYAEDYYTKAFNAADSQRWADANFAARQAGSAVLKEYIQWRRLKDVETRPDAEEILSFIEQHPSWPDLQSLMDRSEEAILLQGVGWKQADRWLRLHEKISQLTKPVDKQDPVTYLIRHAWLNGDFNVSEQQRLRQLYAGQIGPKEIAKRANMLLWNDQINRAKDLIPLLPSAQQKLAYARIGLQTNQRNPDGLVASVPSSLRNDPALIYERMRWRARKSLSGGVQEMLMLAPAKIPYPEKWWNYRAIEIRELIEGRNFTKALQLARNHGQTGGATLADALWLKGWLEMRQSSDVKAAYEDFYALYHHVSYPVSLTRGAYWAGMAAKQNNNADIAKNWFKEAAKHPTTFYGQLALAELYPGQPLSLPAANDNGAGGNFSSEQMDMIALIRLLAQYNQKASVEKFVMHLASLQTKTQNLHALGAVCKKIGYPHLQVRVGKVASQVMHLWLGTTSHPIIKTDALAVEPALALAISRQESEFNPQARSGANALGMMQLLPGTAQHTAQRWGIPYSYEKLFNPEYNMELGSYFLASLIDKFGGSYPLAIAAYNAGPGNVSRWLATYGPMPQDTLGQLNWLESIPFAETRNYVQRVLENLQVYRAMLGTQKPLTAQSILGKN